MPTSHRFRVEILESKYIWSQRRVNKVKELPHSSSHPQHRLKIQSINEMNPKNCKQYRNKIHTVALKNQSQYPTMRLLNFREHVVGRESKS